MIESRVARAAGAAALFRRRNIAVANIVGVLWAAAMFAWFFLSALYLQQVLGYSPLQVGLAFLPANLIMGAFSLGLSAKLVMRFGIRVPLALGLALAAVGLLLFARAPVDGNFVSSAAEHDPPRRRRRPGVQPGAAGRDERRRAAASPGLASGIVNTAFMMGGALGLAVLASVAASRTDALGLGRAHLDALVGGYHLAFVIGAIFALAAAVIGATLLRPAPMNAPEEVPAEHARVEVAA